MAIYGADVPTCVLDPDKVREIRALREQGLSFGAIAPRYGVSREQIGRVVRRRHWAWVE